MGGNRGDRALREIKLAQSAPAQGHLAEVAAEQSEMASARARLLPLSKISTPPTPWYVLPANNKWFRNLAETMESLGMKLPKPKVNLETIRKNYHEAEKEEVRSSAKGNGRS